MGRRKIEIKPIQDDRNRLVTFAKRKLGLLRKAYELSTLCECDVALIIFSKSKRLYQYGSTDIRKILALFSQTLRPHESLTNEDIAKKIKNQPVKSIITDDYSSDTNITDDLKQDHAESLMEISACNEVDSEIEVDITSHNNNEEETETPVLIPCPVPKSNSSWVLEQPLVNHSNTDEPTSFVFAENSRLDVYKNNLKPLKKRTDFEEIEAEGCPGVNEIKTPMDLGNLKDLTAEDSPLLRLNAHPLSRAVCKLDLCTPPQPGDPQQTQPLPLISRTPPKYVRKKATPLLSLNQQQQQRDKERAKRGMEDT